MDDIQKTVEISKRFFREANGQDLLIVDKKGDTVILSFSLCADIAFKRTNTCARISLKIRSTNFRFKV